MWRISAICVIGPQRHGAVGQAQPDRALRLHRPAQGAIVDDVVADGGDAARRFQRRAARQHAAARRRGDRGAADRSPRRRETACRRRRRRPGIRKCSAAAAAGQPRHQRHQHLAAALRPAPPAGARLSGLWAISASVNQRNSGASAAACSTPWFIAQSLPVQPGGRGAPVSTVSRLVIQRARQIAGAVIALVVHQHDVEIARIILGQQAGDAVLDHIGFVARRHHRHHRRPARPAAATGARVALAQAARSRGGPAADRARSPAAESRTECPRSCRDIRWRRTRPAHPQALRDRAAR